MNTYLLALALPLGVAIVTHSLGATLVACIPAWAMIYRLTRKTMASYRQYRQMP